MIQLVGGPLYQWDVGRTVAVMPTNGVTVAEVHFANKGDSHGIPVAVANGEAKIPDRLLQSGKVLMAYGVSIADNEEQTVCSRAFPVRAKQRPKDYVYTEAEQALSELKKITARAEAAAEKVEMTSQGRSAKYYVYTPGWKRILNLIRVSNGMLTVGVAKSRAASGYSCQALAVDFACSVNFPASDTDTKPVVYQRYNHEFGENDSDDVTRRARITQVRIGYPAAGTEFPESDGEVNYETNPVNCYVDVYVDFEPQFEGDRCQLDINYAGFADSHNCEAITEETDAEDIGIYGEELEYCTLILKKDATLYLPEGKIEAKEAAFGNMPFVKIEGTAENPITLKNLSDGVYYITGKGNYYGTDAVSTLVTGIYMVRQFAAYTSVCVIQHTTVHNMRWLKITDTSKTETLIELDSISSHEQSIQELIEKNAMLIYKSAPKTTSMGRFIGETVQVLGSREAYIYLGIDSESGDNIWKRIDNIDGDLDMGGNDITNAENISATNVRTPMLRLTDEEGNVGSCVQPEPYEDGYAALTFYGAMGDEPTRLRYVAPGKEPSDAVNKGQLDAAVGDIETALDGIIAIQEQLMGDTITFYVTNDVDGSTLELTTTYGTAWGDYLASNPIEAVCVCGESTYTFESGTATDGCCGLAMIVDADTVEVSSTDVIENGAIYSIIFA